MLTVAPQPTIAETPFWPQLLLLIACVLAAGVMIVQGIRFWRRERSPVMLLLIAGATWASLQEAPLDIFVSAYYPKPGLWWAYETFGRPVPIWAIFAWMVLFAGSPYLLARQMRRDGVRRVGWKGVGWLAITDVLIELPCLAVYLYQYYGDQPLRVGGFPVHMVAVNAATMMAITVAVYCLEGRIPRRYLGLAFIAPGLAVPASTMFLGLPVWSAVGGGLPWPLMMIASLVTIGLSVAALNGMMRLAEHVGPGMPATTARPQAAKV
jgi:hypothetical protein